MSIKKSVILILFIISIFQVSAVTQESGNFINFKYPNLSTNITNNYINNSYINNTFLDNFWINTTSKITNTNKTAGILINITKSGEPALQVFGSSNDNTGTYSPIEWGDTNGNIVGVLGHANQEGLFLLIGNSAVNTVLGEFNTLDKQISSSDKRISGQNSQVDYDFGGYFEQFYIRNNANSLIETMRFNGDGVTTLDYGLRVGTTFNDGSGALVQSPSYSSNGFAGMDDDTSFWMCSASDCSTTCQVQIHGGLITGCI